MMFFYTLFRIYLDKQFELLIFKFKTKLITVFIFKIYWRLMMTRIFTQWVLNFNTLLFKRNFLILDLTKWKDFNNIWEFIILFQLNSLQSWSCFNTIWSFLLFRFFRWWLINFLLLLFLSKHDPRVWKAYLFFKSDESLFNFCLNFDT